MNKSLYQLAYQNIKKFKRFYIFVCIFIFAIALFYSSFMIIQKSNYQVNKDYSEEEYGYWYMRGIIEEPEKFDAVAKKYEMDANDRFLYAYLYNQDINDDNLQAGYAKESFFEISANRLVQGVLPQNKEQIAVSQKLFQDQHYQLNQTIHLDINASGLKEYQIVGVIHNSQDQLFPDIYTGITDQYSSVSIYSDRALSVDGGREYFSNCVIEINPDIDVNKYGYNHFPTMLNYQESQMDLATLIEGLILVSFVLMSMSSISLKKRSHEFALLRGIGMSTRQLIIMNLYEYMFCTFIGTLLGTLTSIGFSYIIMRYIQSQTSFYHWIFNPIELCLNFLLVMIAIMVVLLYPIVHSSKQALSGTFDTQQFQYIQVHYRKLKHQNKWRLGWRELKMNKKIHIFLIVMLSVHTSLILMNQIIDNYNQVPYQNQITVNFEKNRYLTVDIKRMNDIKLIQSLHFDKTNLIQVKNSIPVLYNSRDSVIYNIVTIDHLNNVTIHGKKPQNEHEILINEHCNISSLVEEESIDEELKIDDKLTINGIEVKVVGIIEPADIQVFDGFNEYNHSLFVAGGIYVMPSLYAKIPTDEAIKKMQIYYDTTQQRDSYIEKMKASSLSLYNTILDQGTIHFEINKDSEPILISTYILIMTLIVSTGLCYYFNKYEMENHQNDYGLYQLIGMTKKDLMKKQLCKGTIIFMIIECFNLGAVYLEGLYLNYWWFPIKWFGGLSGLILLICLVVYGLPLRSIISANPLEHLQHIE